MHLKQQSEKKLKITFSNSPNNSGREEEKKQKIITIEKLIALQEKSKKSVTT